MSTDKEYLNSILSILSELVDISYRPMMGEYVLYYKDKVIGGIYDNRLLLKPTKKALELVENPVFELPYDGAKPYLRPDLNDRELLVRIIQTMYDELPVGKKRS